MGPQRFLERGTDLIVFDRYIGYRFCIVTLAIVFASLLPADKH